MEESNKIVKIIVIFLFIVMITAFIIELFKLKDFERQIQELHENASVLKGDHINILKNVHEELEVNIENVYEQ